MTFFVKIVILKSYNKYYVMTDVYRRLPNDPNYVQGLIEINDPLEMYIQQIMTTFATSNGEVIDIFEYGMDLEQYVFELNYNEYTMRKKVLQQINTYCSFSSDFDTDVEVKFLSTGNTVTALIDVFIDGEPRVGIVVD